MFVFTMFILKHVFWSHGSSMLIAIVRISCSRWVLGVAAFISSSFIPLGAEVFSGVSSWHWSLQGHPVCWLRKLQQRGHSHDDVMISSHCTSGQRLPFHNNIQCIIYILYYILNVFKAFHVQRTGWWPWTHSISKFFPWLIGFPLKLPPPACPGTGITSRLACVSWVTLGGGLLVAPNRPSQERLWRHVEPGDKVWKKNNEKWTHGRCTEVKANLSWGWQRMKMGQDGSRCVQIFMDARLLIGKMFFHSRWPPRDCEKLCRSFGGDAYAQIATPKTFNVKYKFPSYKQNESRLILVPWGLKFELKHSQIRIIKNWQSYFTMETCQANVYFRPVLHVFPAVPFPFQLLFSAFPPFVQAPPVSLLLKVSISFNVVRLHWKHALTDLATARFRLWLSLATSKCNGMHKSRII